MNRLDLTLQKQDRVEPQVIEIGLITCFRFLQMLRFISA